MIPPRPQYPETRKVNVTGSASGVTYSDAYRWLEEDTPETLKWQAAQDELAQSYLRSWPHYDACQTQLADVLGPPLLLPGYGAAGTPIPCGDRWLQVVPRMDAFPQLLAVPDLDTLAELARAALSGSQGHPDPELLASVEVIFTPEQVPTAEPSLIEFLMPSPDGHLVALGLAAGVGKPAVLRFLDVASKTFLPETIDLHAWFGAPPMAWLPDSSGLFYLAGQGPGPRWGRRFVYFHRPGTAPPAVPELALDECAHAIVEVSADGRYATVVQHLTAPRADYIKELSADGEWRPFLSEVNGRCAGFFAGDRYIAVTTDGAPRGKIVSIPVATATDQSTWTELVPEPTDRVVMNLSLAEDQLAVGVGNDNDAQIRLYALDGSPAQTIPAGPGGLRFPLSPNAVTPCSGGFLFLQVTRTTMPAVCRFRRTTGTTEVLIPPPRDLGPLTERRLLARSADGTEVPIHLVHRPGLDTTKAHPVWLSGYGLQGMVQIRPVLECLPFLDAGGIYAWATLRGDGEFGTDWWAQGRRENTPSTYSDFITAAEHLVAEGIARPGGIAISGLSGGGVLTQSVLVRRPDLFAAVTSLLPMTDFFRYAIDPVVTYWLKDEWGDPEDPLIASVMAHWSPYHNVQQEGLYPPTLLICGKLDDFCHPWHSRKMTAALQAASASPGPILLRAIDGLGHEPSGPASHAMLTDSLAFIMLHLGMIPVAPAATRAS